MERKLLLLAVLAIGILLFGCTSQLPKTANQVHQVAPPVITSSIEQQNIAHRLEIVNQASTTMWFYGLSDTGQMIFRSVVNGKVTSSTKRLEPTVGNGNSDIHTNTMGCASQTVRGICSDEIMQADGTFGSSDPYVFWFDNQGNYYQWNGKYILSTQPLKIPNPMIDFQAQNESG